MMQKWCSGSRILISTDGIFPLDARVDTVGRYSGGKADFSIGNYPDSRMTYNCTTDGT